LAHLPGDERRTSYFTGYLLHIHYTLLDLKIGLPVYNHSMWGYYFHRYRRERRMNEFYKSSLEHLVAELDCTRIRVGERVTQMRQENSPTGDDDFRGLYISGEQVDRVVNTARDDKSTNNPGLKSRLSFLEQAEEEIALAKEGSRQRGVELRLDELTRSFSLSKLDVDILLVCLLSEIDVRYGRVYAYLQDDATRKRPTVDLVMRLLRDSLQDRLKMRELFSPASILIKHRLIYLFNQDGAGPAPLPDMCIKVDERIVRYLLGSDVVDERLQNYTRLVPPRAGLNEVVQLEDVRERLVRLAAEYKERSLVCGLHGPDGAGKQTAAAAICRELGKPLLSVDAAAMSVSEIPVDVLTELAFREGRLQKAALLWRHWERLFMDDYSGTEAFSQEVAQYPGWVILSGEKEPILNWHEKPYISISVMSPSVAARRRLWSEYLPDTCQNDLDELAVRFRLTAGQVQRAAAAARSLALWRGKGEAVTAADLYLASRKLSGQSLNSLASKVPPRYAWTDIVLPPEQIAQLKDICGYLRYQQLVYADWGFGQKLALSGGLNVLFAGSSGTGKTMAAEIIANELVLDLYRIDLSIIVSKYVGETEKNLEQVFREGQSANAILFFDEADALFGKRSEVRDSHDRYANIEIAYLLQRMEGYDGMVIMATNLRKNMDEAFSRRMHFVVEFPQPEETERRRIWQSIFPAEAPLDNNLDLPFLARQFKISGGNIKNIALNAAFLAAGNGQKITMEHVILATRREYQKMGKLCNAEEFGCYADLVRG
jgi:SpoVK/Ycf46/Vps4 family AAA+-type ATPase